MLDTIIDPKKNFRNIFLVQNRNFWRSRPFPYDAEKDLVLAFDFGVVHEVTAGGGQAAYLDHLLTSACMERYNRETYAFFATWYQDAQGRDMFAYKGLELGNSFRLDLWNDITYTVRIVLSLLAVKQLGCERIFTGISDPTVLQIIDRLGIKAEAWESGPENAFPDYSFPVFQWMNERIRPSGISHVLKSSIKGLMEVLIRAGKFLGLVREGGSSVFVQSYYPTAGIIDRLKDDDSISVVMEHYTWTSRIWREHRLPVWGSPSSYRQQADAMIADFESRSRRAWEIEGFTISDVLYRMIIKRIRGVLPRCLLAADSVINYFSRRHLKLTIFIANTGLVNTIVLDYCRREGIPSYFILNGLLLHSFPEEETKNVTWINGYGESIKKDYFRDAENVVCLGDPRLDWYVQQGPRKTIDRANPTVMIGAGGFSNIDLSSYVAYEFAFFDEIMSALRTTARKGRRMKTVVKVRDNGYADQYRAFLKEYYPDMAAETVGPVPFKDLIRQADLYITTYSGTLFEASCLGIPVIYYKNDTELLIPPYDGNSELVTARTPDDLTKKIDQFYKDDPVFLEFMGKHVLERYVGPLDGHAVQRNIDFIYALLARKSGAKDQCP